MIPSDPVTGLPGSTIPAEIATSPAWQMIPTGLAASYTALTMPVTSG